MELILYIVTISIIGLLIWVINRNDCKPPSKCHQCEHNAEIALLKLDHWLCQSCCVLYIKKKLKESDHG